MTDSAKSCSESMKACFKCGQSKARTQFYRHPQMNDGLLGKCKECTKGDVRSNRSDKTREYDRRRYSERKHEHIARIAVNAAIQRGEIVRPDGCWACGKECKPEAHHADYNNKLGVVFLCKECHMECHQITTAIKKGNEYARRLGEYFRQVNAELGEDAPPVSPGADEPARVGNNVRAQ